MGTHAHEVMSITAQLLSCWDDQVKSEDGGPMALSALLAHLLFLAANGGMDTATALADTFGTEAFLAAALVTRLPQEFVDDMAAMHSCSSIQPGARLRYVKVEQRPGLAANKRALCFRLTELPWGRSGRLRRLQDVAAGLGGLRSCGGGGVAGVGAAERGAGRARPAQARADELQPVQRRGHPGSCQVSAVSLRPALEQGPRSSTGTLQRH